MMQNKQEIIRSLLQDFWLNGRDKQRLDRAFELNEITEQDLEDYETSYEGACDARETARRDY